MHAKEEGTRRGVRFRGTARRLPQRRLRVIAQARAVFLIACGEKPHEAHGGRVGEGRGGDGERSRHLLAGGKPRERLCERDPEETLAEKPGDVAREAPQDLESAPHPGLRPSEGAPERVLRESIPLVKVLEDGELFTKRGPPEWIVSPQALDLRLDRRPGLHQHPGRGGASLLESEEALEAIDEEELAPRFDGDERFLAVERDVRRGDLSEELQRDLSESYLAQAHGLLSGSESTWKVG